MRFGSPFGAGFGRIDNHLHHVQIETSSSHLVHRVTMEAAPSMGDAFFGVYVNGRKAMTVWCDEGAEIGPVVVPDPGGIQDIQVLRHGANADMSLDRIARVEEESTANMIVLSWTWPEDFLGPKQASVNTSNWVLTGATPEVLDHGDRLTRGQASYSLTVIAGVASIIVRSEQGGLLCTGSGSVGSSVALSGILTGSVDVDLAAVGEVGYLLWRWPSAMRVRRDSGSPVDVLFNGSVSIRWEDPDDLSAGAHSYTLSILTDTGDEGAQSAPVNGDVANPPLPPTNLHRLSGNSANLAIEWTGSLTPGAGYNLYAQDPIDPWMNMATPIALAPGTTTYALPALSFPGKARFLLRATLGGVEERTGAELAVEFDGSGNYVSPRPNAASFCSLSVNLLTLQAVAAYSTAFEKSSPSHAQLFLRTLSGSYNFTVPDGEAALGVAMNGLRLATINATVIAPGWYYVTVKARTSTGVQSESQAEEKLIYLASGTPMAPSFEVEVSRS